MFLVEEWNMGTAPPAWHPPALSHPAAEARDSAGASLLCGHFVFHFVLQKSVVDSKFKRPCCFFVNEVYRRKSGALRRVEWRGGRQPRLLEVVRKNITSSKILMSLTKEYFWECKRNSTQNLSGKMFHCIASNERICLSFSLCTLINDMAVGTLKVLLTDEK